MPDCTSHLRAALVVVLSTSAAGCTVDCVYRSRLDVVALAFDGSAAFVGAALGHFGECDETLEGHAITLHADGSVDDDVADVGVDEEGADPPSEGFGVAYTGGTWSCDACTLTVGLDPDHWVDEIVPTSVSVTSPSGEAEFAIEFLGDDGSVLASTSI